MDINNVLYSSIDKYYKVLGNSGYLNDNEVDRLLVYSFIDSLITNYAHYITEEDYKYLFELANCLSKQSCLIDNIITVKHTMPVDNYLQDTIIRISEDDIIRITDDDLVRLIDSL